MTEVAVKPLRRIIATRPYGPYGVMYHWLECGHVLVQGSENSATYRRRCWKCKVDLLPEFKPEEERGG